MNIYFCGIGGVGLGPLAEIALDAGHTVIGSDPQDSLMTEQLLDRGVRISHDQSGEFLEQIHENNPIDWFVYTSAMPVQHPELQAARVLGIRMSKRDELLAHIIEEKNLKLLAVAGTHGKTGTTGMMVWAMKQLGRPVSYSVGTTMSFGPSGHFEQGSEYFVYECDEFDRNFLHFHPYLSLITSVDYDHSDTYPNKQDYVGAFRQFASQSEFSILWQSDASKLGTVDNSWQLGDNDVAPVQLPGEHIRRNASLIVKALEKLGVSGDTVGALNGYPGIDRRFEKLADNLYTDYGHHPAEIKATLQMAHEVNENVVLVYQPHQNVRQHQIVDEYTDCFELARKVYWLPTYLTREDPNLHVLTPQDLGKNVTNKEALFAADLNDALWDKIEEARKGGALVLAMGAGPIDDWVRKQLAQSR
jgi:UDP-N-acetylmuramate--alanine ligase